MAIQFLGSLPINLETRKLADEGTPIILADQKADISVAIENIVGKIEKVLKG